MSSRGRPEDANLATENYPALNRAFYTAQPHEYLGTRLQHLILEMAKPKELEALLRAGIETGSLKIGSHPAEANDDADPTAADDERAHAQYVATEGAGLLQHTAETLIRLYLAHSGRPPCPWLVLARERSFADFKRTVAERFGQSDNTDVHRADVGKLFYGSAVSPPEWSVPEAEWDANILNTERWLGHFASLFLGDAPLYNAFKHGLAVQVGEAGLKLGDGIVDWSGPSIQHLEKTGDPAMWHRTTTWVKPERMVAEVLMGCRLITNLWLIAKALYVPESSKHLKLTTKMPAYADYRRSELPDETNVAVRTMKLPLLYYEDENGDGA